MSKREQMEARLAQIDAEVATYLHYQCFIKLEDERRELRAKLGAPGTSQEFRTGVRAGLEAAASKLEERAHALREEIEICCASELENRADLLRALDPASVSAAGALREKGERDAACSVATQLECQLRQAQQNLKQAQDHCAVAMKGWDLAGRERDEARAQLREAQQQLNEAQSNYSEACRVADALRKDLWKALGGKP